MNIALISSVHNADDDRIFHHQAASLAEHGHHVTIITSRCHTEEETGNIRIRSFDGKKAGRENICRAFIDNLKSAGSDVIICSDPVCIRAARNYRRTYNSRTRIIYDVTEWYPSIRIIEYYNPLKGLPVFIKRLFFNIYYSRFADSFIFGEWYKSIAFRFMCPRKPFIFLPYYPDLRYFPVLEPVLEVNNIRLSYSGRISLERGFGNFMEVVRKLAITREGLKISLKIIGWFENEKDRKECEKFMVPSEVNIKIITFGRQTYQDYLELIRDTDIFLDLRRRDKETRYSLPIKLFCYTALGRPVIFSDLDAISRDVELESFGFPVIPGDTESVVKIILNYLDNRHLYNQHCRNSRKLAEEKYNWKNIEPVFIKFISD